MVLTLELCATVSGVCMSIHLGCRRESGPLSGQTNDFHVMFHSSSWIPRALRMSEKEKAAE